MSWDILSLGYYVHGIFWLGIFCPGIICPWDIMTVDQYGQEIKIRFLHIKDCISVFARNDPNTLKSLLYTHQNCRCHIAKVPFPSSLGAIHKPDRVHCNCNQDNPLIVHIPNHTSSCQWLRFFLVGRSSNLSNL